jgi:CDP-6-deoxy-D-xylo-4-hexulose-3-dehydrase
VGILVTEAEIRKEIAKNVKELFKHKQEAKFIPGKTKIRYAGAVYSHEEINAIFDATLNGWFGLGQYARQFEQQLKEFIGCERVILTNSGSSANLLAITSLTAPDLEGHLEKGDEVLTPACTFATTFNPIIQNQLMPVVVDIVPETYNVDAEKLSDAISPKTKAMIIPHTLGNPCDVHELAKIAKENNIFLIEDCCDALGSTYAGKSLGSFGVMGTLSMYPAHHITIGEGGAIYLNDAKMYRTINSYRDWGRACYCESTETNSLGACNMRFNWKINDHFYDHKYMYSHIGYNLKPTEILTAMGTEQIKRLPEFTKARKRNFKILKEELSGLEANFIFPESLPKADPSWFAFPLTIRDDSKISRIDLCTYLEKHMIETRYIFSGNVLRHEAYKDVKTRIVGSLENSDRIIKSSFFVGVYPGNSEEKTKYIAQKINDFVKQS